MQLLQGPKALAAFSLVSALVQQVTPLSEKAIAAGARDERWT
jgi:hypothetical protein